MKAAEVHNDPGTKGYLNGTHRLVSPLESLRRVAPLMHRAGITRVANITGLDRIGVPVVSVIRPNSRSLSVSQGKGVTLDAARVSGIMEAIELHHAETIELPLMYGSKRELCARVELVETSSLAAARGSAFHDEYAIQWIESRSLFDGRPVWVPFECVHTDARIEQPAGSGCFSATSNGLASGNHPLEATSHGLCEVVERDSVTLWHLLDDAAREETRLDLATVTDPACRSIIERFERAGLGAMVWDARSEVGIACFVCTIFELGEDPELAIYTSNGSGCHPDKRVALARALTEAAQSRLTLIAGSRDDLWRRMYDDSSRAAQWTAKMRAGFAAPPRRSFLEIESFESPTFADDLRWMIGRLGDAGIRDAFCVDLTREDFGVSVVRVIVPGLEGSDEVADYAPGARARQRGAR